jgi:hypothetical protein
MTEQELRTVSYFRAPEDGRISVSNLSAPGARIELDMIAVVSGGR